MGHQEQKIKLRLLVRQWMEANDFSVTETAKKIKISQSTLTNYLQGTSNISGKLYDKIITALGINEAATLAVPPPLLADALGTVPLVSHSTAISIPNITQGAVVRTVSANVPSLHKLLSYCNSERREWNRFVAIEVDQTQADFMSPILKKSAEIIIDRHYQRIDKLFNDRRPIYAVADKGTLMLGFVYIAGDHWTLRPPSMAVELQEIYFKGNPPRPPHVVGRVCKADTYL